MYIFIIKTSLLMVKPNLESWKVKALWIDLSILPFINVAKFNLPFKSFYDKNKDFSSCMAPHNDNKVYVS